MMNQPVNVAVLGATGLVGETLIDILGERDFPLGTLYPLASERSLGKTVTCRGRTLPVIDAATFDFSEAQIGLFSAGASVSREYAPKAAAAGCVVVDNTSEFRYDDDIPLVVPEVNETALAGYRTRGIIANPNCSTIQLTVALKPFQDAVGLERIHVATYQAVSGAGRAGVERLAKQTMALLNMKPLELAANERQIAFNALPHIDTFQDNGATREEMKLVRESRKILGDDALKVTATA
ncbi:MAG: aspartate-semialdehyde dehydrogenase, partial [Pseudomonadota bacterium]